MKACRANAWYARVRGVLMKVGFANVRGGVTFEGGRLHLIELR